MSVRARINQQKYTGDFHGSESLCNQDEAKAEKRKAQGSFEGHDGEIEATRSRGPEAIEQVVQHRADDQEIPITMRIRQIGNE
jgi:hypothetical protein